MSTPYRVGMIGCGVMGTEHGWAYEAHPDTVLVACADTDAENLAAFGDRFGIPAAARYADYRDLLEREEVDLVGIVTPVSVTPAAVAAAAEAGARGIFAEKPIAASLAEADRMVTVCRQQGIPLALGAIWRNHPYMQKAAELLHAGELGKLLTVTCLGLGPELSGGGCHVINVMRLLDGAEVEWVIGVMESDERARSDHDLSGSGYLRFANGSEGFISRESGLRRGVEVTGEWGCFFWDWMNVHLWKTPSPWESGGDYRALQPLPFPYPTLRWPRIYPGITGGLQSLLDCMAHGDGREPLTSGDDMRRVLEIAIALRESHRRGNVPVQLPLEDRSLRIIPIPLRWDWPQGSGSADGYVKLRTHMGTAKHHHLPHALAQER